MLGLSLALIDNNEVVYYNAYGQKECNKNKKVNKRTVFNGASLTKTYLLYTVLKLADERKIDLDKPVYQYLEYPRLEHDERYKLITARMLLNHSSGIENWQDRNDPKKLEILVTV